METSNDAVTLAPDADDVGDELVDGATLGRYVVLGEIGRGGMGRVLRAYDPRLQREVALKKVRRATLGTADTKRLVAEARALAKLSHPNVVAVYDVEELDDGEVVIVMEFVAGQTLTAWLQHARPWRVVLAQLVRAGRGLAAAHAAGLLHRDFKPDNVLVGDDGRVRVTDFGLAREIVAPPIEEREPTTAPVDANVTAAGALVGTLPYLAPERLMGAKADEACDQFAFCIALWEALFGARPFRGSTAIEIAFAMAAGPPRPRVDAPRVPAWLLAAIARGLATDPAARWPSMPALLDALARSDVRRRRRWVERGAGVAALALGVAGVHAWSNARDERCSEVSATAHLDGAWNDATRAAVRTAMLGVDAPYAEAAWTRTEQTLDDYAARWVEAHVDACAASSVRGEQSTHVLDLRMACLHRAEVELAAVTGVLARADAPVVQEAHQLLAGLRPLARCDDVDALAAEVEPPLPDEADAVDAARTELARARAALHATRLAEARHAVEAARALARGGYAPLRAEVALVHGDVLERLGDYDDARAALQEALRFAADSRQRDEMQRAAAGLAFLVGHELQQFEQGLRYAELADALADGDPARAADVRSAFAAIWYSQGKYADAEAENRRALVLREEALGPDAPAVADSHHNLAQTLQAQGRLDAAEAEHRRAIAIAEASLGHDHPDTAPFRRDLAAVLEELGRFDAAEIELRRALEVAGPALGPTHPDVAAIHSELAIALCMQGELADGEAELRRAIAIEEHVLGPTHPRLAESRHNLANVLAERGRHDDAEAEHRRALAISEAGLAPDHPSLARIRTSLAALLLERGAATEARALAEAAWQRRDSDDTPPALRGHTAFVLARALLPEDPARAHTLAERALVDLGESEDAALVRAWLGEHEVPR